MHPKTAILLLAGYLVGWLLFVGVAFYVVAHFVSKYW